MVGKIMGSLLPLYMCSICRGKFKFGEIKYSPDGKSIVCLDCHSQLAKKDSEKEKSGAKSSSSSPNAHNLIKIICGNCRYKFNWRKSSKLSLKCPYCGKSNLMKRDVTDEKILEEVSRTTHQRLV